MRQINQKMRYSDVEISLLRNTFGGDDMNIFAVRKFLLGAQLEEGEQKFIDGMTEETKKLLRKSFIPSIDPDAPFFQLTDLAFSLKQELENKTRDEAYDIIDTKKIVIKYLQSRFDALDGVKTESPSLEELSDLEHEDVFTRIKARNYLLQQIDTLCSYDIRLLACKKDNETIQQAAERMAKDSTR